MGTRPLGCEKLRKEPLWSGIVGAVGRWLQTYGDAIYGTVHGPIPDQPWGVTTVKRGRFFLQVLSRPADGMLVVPDIGTPVGNVRLLGGDALNFRRVGTDLYVQLPAVFPDAPGDATEGDVWFLAPAIIASNSTMPAHWRRKDGEGVVAIRGRAMPFEAVCNGTYGSCRPLMLVRHPIGIVTIDAPCVVKIAVHPATDSGGLCWLRRLVLAPVD